MAREKKEARVIIFYVFRPFNEVPVVGMSGFLVS